MCGVSGDVLLMRGSLVGYVCVHYEYLMYDAWKRGTLIT